MGSCSDRALEKENYVCFRCFQKLLFKSNENYDISPNELASPHYFYGMWTKQMSPELGEEVVTSVCVGKRRCGGDQMKEDFSRELQRTSTGAKSSSVPHPNAHRVGDAQRWPGDVSAFPPIKPPSQQLATFSGVPWSSLVSFMHVNFSRNPELRGAEEVKELSVVILELFLCSESTGGQNL